jgi:hypothetical protein
LNIAGLPQFYKDMKRHWGRLAVAALLAAGIASSVGCYPAYPPAGYESTYNQDSKDFSVPQESAQGPRYVGVDPALAVAGAAAAGLLGYAIGSNHGHAHYSYYGPVYYRPLPYWTAYGAPRCYH